MLLTSVNYAVSSARSENMIIRFVKESGVESVEGSSYPDSHPQSPYSAGIVPELIIPVTLHIPILGSILPIMGSKEVTSNIPQLGGNIPNMGRIDLPSLGLAQGLFSKVQLRVLTLLFGQPDRQFQGAELIKLASSGVGAVHREIRRLVRSGLVVEIPIGRRKLYRANRNSPVFEELHALIIKTVGLADPIRSALEPFSKHILAAFIFGSIARGSEGNDSDIDIMVIGDDLGYPEVLGALQKVEQRLHRHISIQLVTTMEWHHKLNSNNPFMSNLLSQPRLLLIGNEDDLRST